MNASLETLQHECPRLWASIVGP
jgi:hypothetical protein